MRRVDRERLVRLSKEVLLRSVILAGLGSGGLLVAPDDGSPLPVAQTSSQAWEAPLNRAADYPDEAFRLQLLGPLEFVTSKSLEEFTSIVSQGRLSRHRKLAIEQDKFEVDGLYLEIAQTPFNDLLDFANRFGKLGVAAKVFMRFACSDSIDDLRQEEFLGVTLAILDYLEVNSGNFVFKLGEDEVARREAEKVERLIAANCKSK